jgi:hypothetical protein
VGLGAMGSVCSRWGACCSGFSLGSAARTGVTGRCSGSRSGCFAAGGAGAKACLVVGRGSAGFGWTTSLGVSCRAKATGAAEAGCSGAMGTAGVGSTGCDRVGATSEDGAGFGASSGVGRGSRGTVGGAGVGRVTGDSWIGGAGNTGSAGTTSWTSGRRSGEGSSSEGSGD